MFDLHWIVNTNQTFWRPPGGLTWGSRGAQPHRGKETTKSKKIYENNQYIEYIYIYIYMSGYVLSRRCTENAGGRPLVNAALVEVVPWGPRGADQPKSHALDCRLQLGCFHEA